MATWEDGPEYAPIARPDGFSSADVLPLESTPEPQPIVAAPVQRPEFAGPTVPLRPLGTLVPRVDVQRDPQLPFAVVSSTLTSMDSAWGAAHWTAPRPDDDPTTGPTASPAALQPAAAGWGTATPTPWPGPTAPLPPATGPASLPSGYPPPGTPQWFGPGPGVPAPLPAPAPVDVRAVLTAATPGLLICLAVGGIIFLFAPITLAVAFGLSSRVHVARDQIRQLFLVAWGFVGLLAVARFLMEGSFGWWSFVGGCSLVMSWLVLLAVLVMTYRALKSGRPQPPSSPYTSHWG